MRMLLLFVLPLLPLFAAEMTMSWLLLFAAGDGDGDRDGIAVNVVLMLLSLLMMMTYDGDDDVHSGCFSCGLTFQKVYSLD
jgi:hypothetical protein